VKPKILLADDHELLRRGVRLLLENRSDWEICGEAKNGHEAVEQVLALKPDLVLLDLSMPVMGGIEAARRIRALAPDTKILVFSTHDSPHIASEAMRAGAHGYVVKTAAATELEGAVAALLNGTAAHAGRELAPNTASH
jgi:DNA-binding NarL/FixJ family response regulator